MDETSAATFTLGELADAADVSTRTIRYYISEGLLPPPEGAGHASRYTDVHLTRLRQIAALKAQYLPLREIRNRIGDPPLPALDETRSPRSSARDYLRTLRRTSAPPSRPNHEEDAGGVAWDWKAHEEETDDVLRRRIPAVGPTMSPAPQSYAPLEDAARLDDLAEDLAPPGQVWRRIPIGDAAELVIADDLFRRKRDKVEWLIRWARKVLGS